MKDDLICLFNADQPRSCWLDPLGANLALAGLLARAAMIGYENGWISATDYETSDGHVARSRDHHPVTHDDGSERSSRVLESPRFCFRAAEDDN